MCEGSYIPMTNIKCLEGLQCMAIGPKAMPAPPHFTAKLIRIVTSKLFEITHCTINLATMAEASTSSSSGCPNQPRSKDFSIK